MHTPISRRAVVAGAAAAVAAGGAKPQAAAAPPAYRIVIDERGMVVGLRDHRFDWSRCDALVSGLLSERQKALQSSRQSVEELRELVRQVRPASAPPAL